MDDLRARQEARRRKILQSSEDRLKRIERLKQESSAKNYEEESDSRLKRKGVEEMPAQISHNLPDHHSHHHHDHHDHHHLRGHYINSQPAPPDVGIIQSAASVRDSRDGGTERPASVRDSRDGGTERSASVRVGRDGGTERPASVRVGQDGGTERPASVRVSRDGGTERPAPGSDAQSQMLDRTDNEQTQVTRASQKRPLNNLAQSSDHVTVGTTRHAPFSNITQGDMNTDTTGISDRVSPDSNFSQASDSTASAESKRRGDGLSRKQDGLSRQQGDTRKGTRGEGVAARESGWQRIVTLRTLVFLFLAVNAWLWIVAIFPGQSLVVLFLATELLLFYMNVEQTLPQSRAIQLVSALLSLKGISLETIKQIQRCMGQATGAVQDLATFLFTFLMLHECTDLLWSEAAAQ